MPNFKTKEKFIEQSKTMHEDKYDYSKVDYKGYLVEVCIICSKHGEFMQKPNTHLTKHGCPKCAVERRSKNQIQIIDDFRRSHGNKYDYSKVAYIDDSTKVCIICPKHGEFWQEPNSHKRGVNCPECYEEKRPLSQESFIKNAIKIHGNKYNYSKVNYINAKTQDN